MARSLDSLAERLGDPLNRLYRYPVARAILRALGGLPLRPNHVTAIHTTLGIAGAATFALLPRLHVLAFVLLELRMILDCYDGVLARAKGLASPRGRALDELGDAVGYVAIVVSIAFRAWNERGAAIGVATALSLLVVGGLAAHASDFYKRRLGSALRGEPDAVAAELDDKRARIRAGDADLVTRFGVWFDEWQIRLFEGGAVDLRHPALGRLVGCVSLLSWDNALAILGVGVLVDRPLSAAAAAVAYGLVMAAFTALTARRVFRGAR